MDPVIEAMLNLQARIAGDVIEINSNTWAVHGVIPVDGDVILGEFGTAQDARAVLDGLTSAGD